MEINKPHISRRSIGSVNIFDLYGEVDKSHLNGMHEYMESYIQACNFKNVILNIEKVSKAEKDAAEDLLSILEKTKKGALYSGMTDKIENFTFGFKNKKFKVCGTQEDILKIFGKELVENEKTIDFNERRKAPRIKTALEAKIILKRPEVQDINSHAIITNMTEGGIFAEYLNLSSSLSIDSIDSFKNIEVEVYFNNKKDGDGVIQKSGKILRIEFTGSQTGIAIQFNT